MPSPEPDPRRHGRIPGFELPHARLAGDRATLRRLALWGYVVVAVLFSVTLLLEGRPSAGPVAGIVVIGLVVVGAGLLLAFREPTDEVFALSTGAIPILACGISAWGTGTFAAAYLSMMAAPVLWIAVLCRGRVVAGTLVLAVIVYALALPAPGGPLDVAVSTAIFATVVGLVALVGYARSAALRQASAAARAAADRAEALLDAIPDTVARVTSDGVVLDVRAGPGSKVPQPPGTYLGRSVLEFLPPTVQALAQDALDRAMATGEADLRYEVPLPAGTATVEARVVRSGPDEVVILRRDVTDEARRGREQALLAALVDRMAEAMVVVDPAGIVQLWSAGAERVYGWRAEEVMGRSLGPFIVPDATEASFAEFCRENIAAGQARRILERVRRDGVRIAVEASFTTLRDGAGEPTGILTITRDVTEARAAHDRELHEARLRSLDERMNEIEIVVGSDGCIDHANDRAVAAYGYTRDELLGMSIGDLVAADGSHPPGGELGGTSVASTRFETVHRRKDGSTFPVEVSARGFEIGGVRHVHSLVLDMTERHRHEAEQRQMLNELVEALGKVRTLSGLLPICMYCKKIRNDQGYWDRIEKYVSEHTDAQFSHGMCPECYDRYVEPELRVVDPPGA